MGVTRRLMGYSVQCDTCGHGAFLGTTKLESALAEFNLTKVGKDKNGEDLLKCDGECTIKK